MRIINKFDYNNNDYYYNYSSPQSCPALPDVTFSIQTESTDENLSSNNDCIECGTSSDTDKNFEFCFQNIF